MPRSASTQPQDFAGEQAFPEHDRLHRELATMRRRLFRQANLSVDMLDNAVRALWTLDQSAAAEIRRRDDRVDAEEVGIEQECHRILAYHNPAGADFRLLMFCLKVNAHLERVADHATSIAKIAMRLGGERVPEWPTALTELADRVLVICQDVLRVVSEQDVAEAERLRLDDEVLDRLDKQVFREVEAWLKREPESVALALSAYRAGRELERVGDLMGNIAEELVYLVTGETIRHQKEKKPAR